MAFDRYDTAIVGGGQAGVPLARALASAGKKTVLIEGAHLGGTCVNTGCTPTKTMVASARVAYLARRAADYGVRLDNLSIDLEVVRKRKRDIVDSFREGLESSAKSTANLDVLTGWASFLSADELSVKTPSGEERRIAAETVIINAGCRAAIPAIPGLSDVPWLDNESVMELGSVPEHLIVLGGGYIGLEFGQMFRRFGSKVSVVQRDERLLAREDPDICVAVAEILRQDGIEILLGAETKSVERGANGTVTLTVDAGGQSREISGSHLLVAAGRAPNTDRLNLANAGVEMDKRGFIIADESLKTTASNIWVAGDIKGGPAFTHISYDDYRILKRILLNEDGIKTTKNRYVPYSLFIDPSLGRVGLTETQANAAGLKTKTAKMPMEHVARALETDESRGLMKATVDADTGRILGCSVLGIEGGEIMAMIQIAMMGDLHYTALRDATFSHPNLSESLNNLFSSLE